MDCTFLSPEGRFNLRVGAVIVHQGRLLGVHDQGRDANGFHYLPGGRVKLHETMEQALCRELWEELGVRARVIRPLWLWESFFPQDRPPHHGLEMFFLTELDWESLPSLTEPFSRVDTDGERHFYRWLTLGDSPDYIFPDFVQESFPRLPERLTFVSGKNGETALGPDCKFAGLEGRFNFRVAGLFLQEGRLLAMKEESIPHWYLPGGRVKLHETMEQALCREVREELGAKARVVQPLWLCESFFDLAGEPVHELCLYYLAQLDWESLPSLTGEFRRTDSDGEEHIYAWLTEEQVRSWPIYPLVMQKNWPVLPESLTLVTDERDRGAGRPVDKTFGKPVPGVEYVDRKGAYLVAVEEGLLAVAETPKGWFLPGGGIEPGEDHWTCIRRECAEELGRKVEIGEYLGCGEAYITHPGETSFHLVQYYYVGKLGEAAGEPTEPDHVLKLVPAELAAENLYVESQRFFTSRLLR